MKHSNLTSAPLNQAHHSTSIFQPLFLISTLLLIFVGCSKNPVTPSHEVIVYKGAQVVTTKDLPLCEQLTKGLTYYVLEDSLFKYCDGTRYQTINLQGEKGDNTLLLITEDTLWTYCPLGGSKIETGADNNKNGLLDSVEVSATSYLCEKEKIWRGDYTIQTLSHFNIISLYNKITGNLTIKNTTITHLDGLESLTSIGGSLLIEEDSNLTNLDGLKRLKTVGGELNIYNNEKLNNLDGLKNVTTIEGNLKVEYNDSLTHLDGLSSLTSIGGSLSLYSNEALININGLSTLTSIGGSLNLEYNTALIDIEALAGIHSLGGSLILYTNTTLKHLDGLRNIKTIKGEFLLENSSDLINMTTGLASLISIQGEYTVLNNSNLPTTQAKSIQGAITGITEAFVSGNKP